MQLPPKIIIQPCTQTKLNMFAKKGFPNTSCYIKQKKNNLPDERRIIIVAKTTEAISVVPNET